MMDMNREGEGYEITAYPYVEGRKMKHSQDGEGRKNLAHQIRHFHTPSAVNNENPLI